MFDRCSFSDISHPCFLQNSSAKPNSTPTVTKISDDDLAKGESVCSFVHSLLYIP